MKERRKRRTKAQMELERKLKEKGKLEYEHEPNTLEAWSKVINPEMCFNCGSDLRSSDGHFHTTAHPVRHICCACASCSGTTKTTTKKIASNKARRK